MPTRTKGPKGSASIECRIPGPRSDRRLARDARLPAALAISAWRRASIAFTFCSSTAARICRSSAFSEDIPLRDDCRSSAQSTRTSPWTGWCVGSIAPPPTFICSGIGAELDAPLPSPLAPTTAIAGGRGASPA